MLCFEGQRKNQQQTTNKNQIARTTTATKPRFVSRRAQHSRKRDLVVRLWAMCFPVLTPQHSALRRYHSPHLKNNKYACPRLFSMLTQYKPPDLLKMWFIFWHLKLSMLDMQARTWLSCCISYSAACPPIAETPAESWADMWYTARGGNPVPESHLPWKVFNVVIPVLLFPLKDTGRISNPGLWTCK